MKQKKVGKPHRIQRDYPDHAPLDRHVERLIVRISSYFGIKSDLSVISPRAIRMDLRTTLDLPLAAIVLTDQKINYALYRDKKFYTGRPGPHALDPVFPMSVDVKTLIQILQEQEITGASCQSDEKGPLGCRGSSGGIQYQVTWSKRQTSGPLAGRASKVVLDLPDRHVSLRFYFNDLQQKLPNAERLLSLQVPPGFATFSTP